MLRFQVPTHSPLVPAVVFGGYWEYYITPCAVSVGEELIYIDDNHVRASFVRSRATFLDQIVMPQSPSSSDGVH